MVHLKLYSKPQTMLTSADFECFIFVDVPSVEVPRAMIHKVQWDSEMHKPAARKLVNETHGEIFILLQSFQTLWNIAFQSQ